MDGVQVSLITAVLSGEIDNGFKTLGLVESDLSDRSDSSDLVFSPGGAWVHSPRIGWGCTEFARVPGDWLSVDSRFLPFIRQGILNRKHNKKAIFFQKKFDKSCFMV